MNRAEHRIREARTALVVGSPFFATLALHLKLREDTSCLTAYTDSVVFGYNPRFINTLDRDELKALIAHEVLHIALGHAFRKDGRDHFKWNVACDHAVNWILRDEGYTLPDGALLDTSYLGKSAEEIYVLLPDKENPISKNCPWMPMMSDSGESGANAVIPQDINNIQKQYIPGMTGEVRDLRLDPNETDKSLAEHEAEWKVRTAQAATAAKIQGRLRGGLRRMIEKMLTPQLPWQEILARFVSDSSRNDYNWKRPSPRYLHSGLYLPDLDKPSLGEIAVVVDTSGSVSDGELARYTMEIRSILQAYPETHIHVLYVDSELAHHEYLDAAELELHPRGGGGTSYVPAFEYLAAEDKEPCCLIYFTDGYCDDFPAEPDYPVLWILDSYADFEPPFGEVCRVKA
ncbi:MAG: metallopeptidase domain containing protein [Candidatus Cloacimonetes bacterium]|nr:metallopeptidase domain containing protein [Candidatus Cloacimonadota bacterium]